MIRSCTRSFILHAVQAFTGLEALTISRCNTVNAGLEALGALTRLRALALYELGKLSDGVLASLVVPLTGCASWVWRVTAPASWRCAAILEVGT